MDVETDNVVFESPGGTKTVGVSLNPGQKLTALWQGDSWGKVSVREGNSGVNIVAGENTGIDERRVFPIRITAGEPELSIQIYPGYSAFALYTRKEIFGTHWSMAVFDPEIKTGERADIIRFEPYREQPFVNGQLWEKIMETTPGYDLYHRFLFHPDGVFLHREGNTLFLMKPGDTSLWVAFARIEIK